MFVDTEKWVGFSGFKECNLKLSSMTTIGGQSRYNCYLCNRCTVLLLLYLLFKGILKCKYKSELHTNFKQCVLISAPKKMRGLCHPSTWGIYSAIVIYFSVWDWLVTGIKCGEWGQKCSTDCNQTEDLCEVCNYCSAGGMNESSEIQTLLQFFVSRDEVQGLMPVL